MKVEVIVIILLLLSKVISAQNYEINTIKCIENNCKSVGLNFENEIKNIRENLILNNIISPESSSILKEIKEIKRTGVIEETRSYESVLFEQIGLKTIEYCSVLNHYTKDSFENTSIINMFSEIKLYLLNLKPPFSISSFNRSIASIIDKYLNTKKRNSKLWNYTLISYLYLFSQTQEMKILNTKLPEFTPSSQDTNSVVKIFVNKNDEIFLNGKQIKKEQICTEIESHILNNNSIALQNEMQTKYNTYLAVYNILKSCYAKFRDDKSKELYSKSFYKLSLEKKNKIRKIIPIRIIETE